jgi:secondary thiamine-phosphate synthase enzyme
MQTVLEMQTPGRGFTELTGRLRALVEEAGIETGLCQLFIRHTSASLLIMENADPDVLLDLETFLSELVPDGDPRYRHTAEGPDDMAAHVRSMLTRTDLAVPIRDGALALGTWQGLYLWEHREHPHRRQVVVTLQSVR